MSNIIFMARLTDEGDFAAVLRAESLLTQHGFSVGSTQRGSPRGIIFGAYDIQKWRNLNEADRAALHGIMEGDRSSYAQIEIWDPAPVNAVAALANALEGEPHTVVTKRPPLVPNFPKISPTEMSFHETRNFYPTTSGGNPHAE